MILITDGKCVTSNNDIGMISRSAMRRSLSFVLALVIVLWANTGLAMAPASGHSPKCHARMMQHAPARDPLRHPGSRVGLLPPAHALHALLPVAPGACSYSVRRPPWLLRHWQATCAAVGFPGRLWQFSLRPVERQRPCRPDGTCIVRFHRPLDRSLSPVHPPCL